MFACEVYTNLFLFGIQVVTTKQEKITKARTLAKLNPNKKEMCSTTFCKTAGRRPRQFSS